VWVDFATGSDAHYYPDWADPAKDIQSSCGPMIHISSRLNYEFKPGKSPTSLAGTKKIKEQHAIGQRRFPVDQCRELIEESNYMIINDPLKFLSYFLAVPKQVLHDVIHLQKTRFGS
jgi:hypothetical protein